MKNKAESLFFIAISPVGPVQELVNSIKTDIYQKYQLNGAFRSPAHITLQMPFRKKLSKIDSLKTALSKFATTQQAFHIELNGFGCFEPRVVFINVKENNVLLELQLRLQKLLKLHQIFNSNYRNQAYNPHITIAFRDLKKQQFHPLWDEYKNKDFEESFKAEGICLYELSEEKWKVLSYFPFDT